jgi:hypothetical protein
LVLIRLRNPCSRFRRTLLGWYVRFTTNLQKVHAPKKSARPNHPERRAVKAPSGRSCSGRFFRPRSRRL